MTRQEAYLQIEKILDQWDPLGVLESFKQLNYEVESIGEYTKYVQPVISIYFSNGSVYDYLVHLNTELRDVPNNIMLGEIKIATERICNYLSQYSIQDFLQWSLHP